MRYANVYGGNELDDKKEPGSRKKAPLMPNPFPEDIYSLIAAAVTIPGLAAVIYKWIKLWVDYQKAKKIKIKKGEIEIEIQGGMSEKEIKNVLDAFRKAARVKDKNEVKITIPESCDPELPKKLLMEENQK